MEGTGGVERGGKGVGEPFRGKKGVADLEWVEGVEWGDMPGICRAFLLRILRIHLV